MTSLLLSALVLAAQVPIGGAPPRPTGDCPSQCDYVSRMMGQRCSAHEKPGNHGANGAGSFKQACADMAGNFLDICLQSCKQKGSIDPDFMREKLGKMAPGFHPGLKELPKDRPADEKEPASQPDLIDVPEPKPEAKGAKPAPKPPAKAPDAEPTGAPTRQDKPSK